MTSSAADRLRDALDTPPYRAMMARLAPLQLRPPALEQHVVRDALGGVTRRRFRKTIRLEKFAPSLGDEFFDWLGLFESVLEARGPYVMVELGAGYGRWTAFAAQLCRALGRPLGCLVACEAEPMHHRWLLQHLGDNGVDPSAHRMIRAAVSDRRGRAPFYVGAAAEWYGQSLTSRAARASGVAGWLRRLGRAPGVMEEVAMVETVTLADILAGDLPTVDFMHVDIQGVEFDVFRPAMELMSSKVRRVHVAIHSATTEAAAGRDLDVLVAGLFEEQGWTNLQRARPGETRDLHERAVMFNDGVQVWRNPRL